jgi:hypothetical protein
MEKIKLNTNWKIQYQIMWNNTPKRLRKSISQINNIRSQSKIFVELYGLNHSFKF